MINKFKYLIFLSFFAPAFAFAQAFDLNAVGVEFKTIVQYFLDIIKLIIPILFALAFIVFFWGLSKFILNSDKPDEIKRGKNYMFWGIIVLFLLVSVRAIISFISSDLEFGNAKGVPLLPGAGVDTGCVVQLPDGTFVPC